MENYGFCRTGQSFDWILPIGTYFFDIPETPRFNISGTNSKWKLKLFKLHESKTVIIKLTKIGNGVSSVNRLTIITFVEELGIKQRKDIDNFFRKTEHIVFVSKVDPFLKGIKVLKGTCVYFIESSNISTQASVGSIESQNKHKSVEDDSSKNLSELSWNSVKHLESLSKDFGDAFQKSIKTDIVLISGEVCIPAHRAVLMSRSKVFSSMFEHEMSENVTGSIDVSDIEPSVLHEFLKYLYSGKFSDALSPDVPLKLYETSIKYTVQSLQKGCRNMLVGNLTEENCIDLLILGDKHSDEELKNIIAEFIIKRREILKSDAWNEFSDNFPMLANTVFQKYIEESS